MEVSSLQQYISQFFQILADPIGIMALIAMLGLAMLVVIVRSARWLALSLALFAIVCSLPANKYMPQGAFLAPLQIFRVWSRPITFVCLLVLLACMIRFDRGPRRQLMTASFWLFVAYQIFGSLRLLLVPSLADRGLGAFSLILLIVGVAILALAPGLHSLQDASKLVWAIAGCCLLFISTSLMQYAVTPRLIQHGNRLFGMSGNPQYASYLMALTLPTLCYLLVRRKQGIWVTQSLVVFGAAIPVTALMLVWTGSRGGLLTAILGVVVFFHRRLGRFLLASAVCLMIGIFLSQYLGDAFDIVNRFFAEGNTRAGAWAQMLKAIGENPIFGEIQDTGNVYNSNSVGEGGILMSLSLYGVVGSLPMFLSFGMIGYEIFQLNRIRKLMPELNDLTDLVTSFWCAFIFANLFESFVVSYFTNSMLLMYAFWVLHGFIVDYSKQAAEERMYGFQPVMPLNEQYPQYAVY